jgi:hypothetical protein
MKKKNDDMRQYNGGARPGAGHPKTIDANHQVAVRLPEDMNRWLWRRQLRTHAGSVAEVMRQLIRDAMEQDAADLDSAHDLTDL